MGLKPEVRAVLCGAVQYHKIYVIAYGERAKVNSRRQKVNFRKKLTVQKVWRVHYVTVPETCQDSEGILEVLWYVLVYILGSSVQV